MSSHTLKNVKKRAKRGAKKARKSSADTIGLRNLNRFSPVSDFKKDSGSRFQADAEFGSFDENVSEYVPNDGESVASWWSTAQERRFTFQDRNQTRGSYSSSFPYTPKARTDTLEGEVDEFLELDSVPPPPKDTYVEPNAPKTTIVEHEEANAAKTAKTTNGSKLSKLSMLSKLSKPSKGTQSSTSSSKYELLSVPPPPKDTYIETAFDTKAPKLTKGSKASKLSLLSKLSKESNSSKRSNSKDDQGGNEFPQQHEDSKDCDQDKVDFESRSPAQEKNATRFDIENKKAEKKTSKRSDAEEFEFEMYSPSGSISRDVRFSSAGASVLSWLHNAGRPTLGSTSLVSTEDQRSTTVSSKTNGDIESHAELKGRGREGQRPSAAGSSVFTWGQTKKKSSLEERPISPRKDLETDRSTKIAIALKKLDI